MKDPEQPGISNTRNAAEFSTDEDENEEMIWDSSWIQPQPKQEKTKTTTKNAKDWENTGEGVACLTFLHGQAFFNAKKYKELVEESSITEDENQGNNAISVEVHGVPFDDEDSFPPPPPPEMLNELMQEHPSNSTEQEMAVRRSEFPAEKGYQISIL